MNIDTVTLFDQYFYNLQLKIDDLHVILQKIHQAEDWKNHKTRFRRWKYLEMFNF